MPSSRTCRNHNDAAEGRAVAADELSSGVNNDISAVLNRTDEVRGTEGVVDYERQTVLMCDGGNGVDVGDVGVGVAERLQIYRLGVVLNSRLHLIEMVGVDKKKCRCRIGGSVCASRL